MTEIERLQELLKMRDKMISVYDECRLKSESISYQNFKKIKEIREINDILINSYIESLPGVTKIIATKDVIIEPSEFKEIKTNITGSLDKYDIIFEGYLPSDGYLGSFTITEKNGLEIYIKNKVPRLILETYPSGYHFCDPTVSRYFEAGVYQIKEGTVLGVAIKREKHKDNGHQYSKVNNK